MVCIRHLRYAKPSVGHLHDVFVALDLVDVYQLVRKSSRACDIVELIEVTTTIPT